MENVLDTNMSAAELSLNSAAKEYLRQTAKWAKFLAIVGIIFSLLIIVAAFTIGTLLNTIMAMSPTYAMMGGQGMPKTMMIMVGVIYAILGLIFLYPCVRLLQFASRAKEAIEANDSLAMEVSMKRLRSVFRFYGILTIIMIVFYVLAILGFIVGMSAMKSM